MYMYGKRVCMYAYIRTYYAFLICICVSRVDNATRARRKITWEEKDDFLLINLFEREAEIAKWGE